MEITKYNFIKKSYDLIDIESKKILRYMQYDAQIKFSQIHLEKEVLFPQDYKNGSSKAHL